MHAQIIADAILKVQMDFWHLVPYQMHSDWTFLQVAVAISLYCRKGLAACFALWKAYVKESIRRQRLSACCIAKIVELRKAAMLTAWHVVAGRNAAVEKRHRSKQRELEAIAFEAWQLCMLLNKAEAHWRARSGELMSRWGAAVRSTVAWQSIRVSFT